MKDLENNKLLAAFLLAGLIALACGKISSVLYAVEKDADPRGFEVSVVDTNAGTTPVEEVKLDLPTLLAQANVAKGKKLFSKCQSCHTNEKDGAHRVGPALWGVADGVIARHSDYSYSKALQKKNAANDIWDDAALFAFLKKPRDFAKGTKMSFSGFKKDQDAANMIVYLRSKAE